MNQKTKESLIKAIKKVAPDGRLSCQEARQVAEEEGADYKDIGRECDRLGIKIHTCQLGCF